MIPELTISIRIPGDVEIRVGRSFTRAQGIAAQASAEILYDVTVDELQARGHKAEGDLEASLATEVDIEHLRLGTLARLRTEDVAAKVLEGGADATDDGGPVNVDAIEAWLGAKNIEASYGTRRSFAYAIARKIGREGQNPSTRYTSPGRPFNNAQRKARRRILKVWQQDFPREFARGMAGGATR
jgi:hypothetical protein